VRLIHSLKSRRDAEEGFTLIELMVVVLIIAILIAIAIPTFLGARQRAQDSAAKSDLRNAAAAAKVFYTDAETYVGMNSTTLEAIEPSLTYATSGSKTEVGVSDLAAGAFLLTKQSKSDKWFGLAEKSDGTKYCSGTAAPTYAGCNGANW
jgi:type IV pilus assembly protein PilA